MSRFFVTSILLVLLFSVEQFRRIQCMEQSLNFLVLGDWGGLPIDPFYTDVENAVSKKMAICAKQSNAKFILALGDNFYFTGVDDVNDARFQETFENVFNAASLEIPWYLCAGNHDHYGDVAAEIAYTEKSPRWNFPEYYYTKTFSIPGSSATVQVVMIDTVLLCGNTKADYHHSQPEGPTDHNLASSQWVWLAETLQSSDADYLIVAGHFPVWSIAEHGPTGCLVKALKPLLEKFRVTAYFSGHDHNLQHLDDGSGVHYFVSGCANFVDDSNDHVNDVPVGSSKFFWANITRLGGFNVVRATPTAMQVTFVDSTGLKPLYTKTLQPRNKRSDIPLYN